MANHFYGTAYEEHGEKEIKNFTPLDWFINILFWGAILAAVVMGFLQQWGIMVMLIGFAVCMMHVLVRVVVGVKSKIMWIFSAIGIATIVGGVITATGHYEYLFYYGMFIYVIVSFGVGFFCLSLASKKRKKMREYTLMVEADCELVDEKRINLFRFDDISPAMNSSLNVNTLRKPGFHYYVNGEEYFTESTVYYGDLNTGFEEGARVTLRVNPKDPTQILPKNESTIMEMFMGVFWIMAGVLVTLVMALIVLL